MGRTFKDVQGQKDGIHTPGVSPGASQRVGQSCAPHTAVLWDPSMRIMPFLASAVDPMVLNPTCSLIYSITLSKGKRGMTHGSPHYIIPGAQEKPQESGARAWRPRRDILPQIHLDQGIKNNV